MSTARAPSAPSRKGQNNPSITRVVTHKPHKTVVSTVVRDVDLRHIETPATGAYESGATLTKKTTYATGETKKMKLQQFTKPGEINMIQYKSFKDRGGDYQVHYERGDHADILAHNPRHLTIKNVELGGQPVARNQNARPPKRGSKNVLAGLPNKRSRT